MIRVGAFQSVRLKVNHGSEVGFWICNRSGIAGFRSRFGSYQVRFVPSGGSIFLFVSRSGIGTGVRDGRMGLGVGLKLWSRLRG